MQHLKIKISAYDALIWMKVLSESNRDKDLNILE